jgi:hypothetical protein
MARSCSRRSRRRGSPPYERRGAAILFTVTSDQIFGMFTFSIDCGCISACARNACKSRSALKPMWIVNGEIIRSMRDRIALGLRKWFRRMMRPPGRHTRRISWATFTGSGTTLIRYGA